MNTKLLKQKILDLAIRGKLTQQFKSDGTARELLEQISSKVSSSSSTLSSPRRRGSPSSSAAKTIIPLDKSEAPFEIPANWEWVRLGDVCDISSAKRVLKEDWKDSGIPFYRAREIAQLANGEKVKDDLFITKELYESLKRQYGVPQPGDILMSAVGTIGKTYIVQKNDCFYYKDASVICLKIRSLNISPTFLKILLASDFLQKQMYANSSGTTVDTITISVAQEYFFPLPPFAEQQRIVAKIEEAFAEIDAIEKNKELLKTHIKQTRQKILDLAIHGKLVPQNKSDEPASVLLERITRDNPHYEKLTDIPFEIPESWEWVNAEDLFNIRSAIRIHQTDWQKEGIPFFRGRELVQLCKTGNVDFEIYISEKLYEENKRKGGVPQKNDILVSAVGTLGFAYVVKGNKPFYYKDAYILCFENRHNLNPFYFQHLIHSKFINKIIYGGSKGTTVDQLTIENAKKLPMPLPPLAEQKRIVDKIEEIFASLDEISLHLV